MHGGGLDKQGQRRSLLITSYSSCTIRISAFIDKMVLIIITIKLDNQGFLV